MCPPHTPGVFLGVSRCFLEAELWAQSRHALLLTGRSRGREHSALHPGAGRAGSVPYGAAYFSPLLTSTSRALFAAKCFSRAHEDAFPALLLSRDGAAACSPRCRDAGQEPVPGSQRARGRGICSSRLVATRCWWQHPLLPMERLGAMLRAPGELQLPGKAAQHPHAAVPNHQ